MTPRTQHRRGVALLLALLAVSLLSVTGVGLVRTATNHAVSSDLTTERAQAESLLMDIAAMFPSLMTSDDTRPAGEIQPGEAVRVLDRRIEHLHVWVDRHDLSGRLHLSQVSTFAAQGLPSALDGLGAAINKQERTQEETQSMTLEQIIALLPAHDQVGVRAFTGHESDAVVLSDWVTPHGDGTLNIQTAPIALLRAALQGLDPTAANDAIAHRLRGEAIPASLARQLITERRRRATPTGSTRAIPLSTNTRAVAFHVTIEQQSTIEQWWIVLEPRDDKSEPATGWSLVRPIDPKASWQITRWRRIA